MSFSRSTISFQREKSLYVFHPEEDITAYEIAQLLPILIADWKNAPDGYAVKRGEMAGRVFNYEELDQPLRRHFRKV